VLSFIDDAAIYHVSDERRRSLGSSLRNIEPRGRIIDAVYRRSGEQQTGSHGRLRREKPQFGETSSRSIKGMMHALGRSKNAESPKRPDWSMAAGK
jgi:hypothetical protein